jgi:hypothetical protein
VPVLRKIRVRLILVVLLSLVTLPLLFLGALCRHMRELQKPRAITSPIFALFSIEAIILTLFLSIFSSLPTNSMP